MRLIDADKLKRKIYHEWIRDKKEIDRVIDSEPTIDAVEVVRCKDCKWWKLVDDYYAKGYGECTCPRSAIKSLSFLNEDWYCADGERKEDDD